MAVHDSYTGVMKVRYRDTDAQGHLYFANYLVFADELAGDYLEDLGYSTTSLAVSGTLIFTVNVGCDYLGECGYGDAVRISVHYESLGNSSAVLVFGLCNDRTGEPLAEGRITQVFVNRETRRSCPIPKLLREAIVSRQPGLSRHCQ